MAWLPLLLTLLAMPALAYAATTFIIVPQIERAVGQTASGGQAADAPAQSPSSHGGAPEKQSVSLNKMIVNVAGTLGTRYLVASVTLVGGAAGFKDRVEQQRDRLLDVANSTLSNKTIADLEAPGARNQIRAELMSGFNSALGEGAVKEIFITEFAIQ
jgi:flagellar FliL protein